MAASSTTRVPTTADDPRVEDTQASTVVSTDPLWSESFYLNFADPEGRIAGLSRIGLHPVRGESDALLCLYLPGGAAGCMLSTARCSASSMTTPKVGTHAHECVEPLRVWRLTYEGTVHRFDDPQRIPDSLRRGGDPDGVMSVSIALEFMATHAPVFYPEYLRVTDGPPAPDDTPASFGRSLRRALRRPSEIVSALKMGGAKHYEQSMTVRGSVTVDGLRYDVDGSGHRDHSWGRRDWAPSERWRWITGQVDDVAFSAMYLTVAGTHVVNGFVRDDDRIALVDALRLKNTFDAAGFGARTLTLDLDAGGKHYAITGEVSDNLSLPIDGARSRSQYTIGRTRFRIGDRVGYGVAEFLERLDP